MLGRDRRVRTRAQQRELLRPAAVSRRIRMAEGRESRDAALAWLRTQLPGFPRERYEEALEAASCELVEGQAHARARRRSMIAAARELDPLNAVCTLHVFNRRGSGHVLEYGLGPIDLAEALGDLCSAQQIADAVGRTDALLADAVRRGREPGNEGRADRDRLRDAHPGFTARTIDEAWDWGCFTDR